MKEEQDFSGVAKDLLDIVIKRVDPVSWYDVNLFGNRYFLSCFKGNKDIICAAKLCDLHSDSFYSSFLIEIFNKTKKSNPVYLFDFLIYNPLKLRTKNKKQEGNILGHVEVEGFSYRDENYFTIKTEDLNFYNNYLVKIINNNFVGCTVDVEGDNGPMVETPNLKPRSTKIKIPSLKTLKKMVEQLKT